MAAREDAERAGLPWRTAYTPKETALYSGVPYRWLLTEIAAGRLRAKRYNDNASRRPRFLIQPEWMDEWMGRG
jgi:hypothetical protein